MPTNTELIDQLHATVTKLTNDLALSEGRNLALCREIDQLRKDLNTANSNYELLTGLGR